ncbi:MAG: RNA polymerase factor sigma-54 [Burkholderiales bacterium]|nr:RNA polymerase factor sigma-54 [Burkholderiales bacterium]
MSAPAIRLENRQRQVLTPRLQQAVRLLQLSSTDFAQEVRDALGKNPFLEPEESPGESREPSESLSLTAKAPPQPLTDATPPAPQAVEPEGPWDREQWSSATTSRAGAGEASFNLADTLATEMDLRQYLENQVTVWPLSPREHVLVSAVIESLDDDGYLRTDLGELSALTGLVPAPDAEELADALVLVQSLDPCGVGARSVCECLLLQMPTIEDNNLRELAQIIVKHYLNRLAQRDVAGLARTLSCKHADIDAACERIRHLDPRPGWRVGAAQTQYVTPDVIVKKNQGGWAASVNPAVVPHIRINQLYADLFQQHRDSTHAELATSLQEARWTVRNVEQRFSTILSVAQAILKRQHHFLEFGPLAMKPLGLREIADEVGLHESTVCRVTNNKYMATPVGVFELKYFFSRAMPTSNGGSCSAMAIRGVIKDIIDTESLYSPLSDAEIARQLARQGLTVARRTVTKYRQMLKLPPINRRRTPSA